MHRNPIPARRKPQAPTLPLVTLAVAGIVTFGALAGWTQRDTNPDEPSAACCTGTVHTGEIHDPAVFTPADKPKVATLRLRLPELSIEQHQYKRMAEVLPRMPIAYGLDEAPIGFTDNEAVIFTALIYTESSFTPYNADGTPLTSSAGCQGIAQLCGDLLTHEAIFSPAMNLYIGAKEFKRLISAHDGDIMAAINAYKGVVTPDMQYVSERVWDYVLIENVQ